MRTITYNDVKNEISKTIKELEVYVGNEDVDIILKRLKQLLKELDR